MNFWYPYLTSEETLEIGPKTTKHQRMISTLESGSTVDKHVLTKLIDEVMSKEGVWKYVGKSKKSSAKKKKRPDSSN